MSINVDLGQPGNIRRQGALQYIEAKQAKSRTKGSADNAQKNTLSEQLKNDSPAACTQGSTHSHFFLPRSRAGQQKIGDVYACHQQDEEHRPEQRQQHCLYPGHAELLKRSQISIRAIIGGHGKRNQLEHLGKNGFELGAGLCNVYAGAKPGDYVVSPSPIGDIRWININDCPNLRGNRKIKAGRHHTDNFVIVLIQHDMPADNPGISSELCLPQVMANDRGAQSWRFITQDKVTP